MRDRERERQREKQASCREPYVGLNPGTTGSHPEPKADAQPLSHPGVPEHVLSFKKNNDPEGDSEAGMSATVTRSPVGRCLRGRNIYLILYSRRPPGFQSMRTTSQFQQVRLLPGLRWQSHHPSVTRG